MYLVNYIRILSVILVLVNPMAVAQTNTSETADQFMRFLFERYHGFLDRSDVLQDCKKTDAIKQITLDVQASSDSTFVIRLYLGSIGGLQYSAEEYATIDRYISEFWRGEKSLTAIAEQIISEFNTLKSVDTVQFVTLVYKNFLDREPDPEGLTFWSSYLSANDSQQRRASLLVLFAESAEALQKMQSSVNTLLAYYSLLKKLPTKEQMRENLSLDDLIKKLLEEQKSVQLPCTSKPISPPPAGGGSGNDNNQDTFVVCPDGNELAVEEPIPHGTFSRLIKKGQCYSFRFNSGGVPGFVSFSEATGGQRQTAKIVTISRRKADFSQSSVSRECYREDIINTIQYRIKPINPELQGAVCALEPNTDYYINIRDVGCFAGETCSFKMVRG